MLFLPDTIPMLSFMDSQKIFSSAKAEAVCKEIAPIHAAPFFIRFTEFCVRPQKQKERSLQIIPQWQTGCPRRNGDAVQIPGFPNPPLREREFFLHHQPA